MMAFSFRQLKKKTCIWFVTLLAIGICVVLIALFSRQRIALPVRIAIPMQPTSAMMIVAMEKGFFESAGLAPEFSLFPSGKRALSDGLDQGLADVTSTADLPAAEKLHLGQDLTIVTTFHVIRSINTIVARSDHGIQSIDDLRGKRVGTQHISAIHFFLDRALKLGGISTQEVQVVYYLIEDLAGALLDGEVDAISIREPYTSQVLDALGEKALAMDFPWIYPQFELLVTGKTYARDNPQVLERMIEALIEAENFMIEKPSESALILSHALEISLEEAQKLMDNLISHVGIPQSLLHFLETQLLWLDDYIQVDRPTIDLLDTLYLDALRSSSPERIHVIGYSHREAP